MSQTVYAYNALSITPLFSITGNNIIVRHSLTLRSLGSNAQGRGSNLTGQENLSGLMSDRHDDHPLMHDDLNLGQTKIIFPFTPSQNILCYN